jgi:hypothetical protein
MKSKIRWGASLCAALLFSVVGVALADDVSNSLDLSVDATAEVMPLQVGGANGSTTLRIVTDNGDGKNGCNLTGQTTLKVAIQSSDTSVATASLSDATFTSCGDTKTVTVHPVAAGSATITVSQLSNDTGATFDFAPATFTVNVTKPTPANTPPHVSVTGFADGDSFELGADMLPTADCSATDAEDGPSSPDPVIDTSDLVRGLGLVKVTCSTTDRGGLMAKASAMYSIVDTIAPVITFDSRTPADAVVGDTAWNKDDVTVTWTCSDSGSGVVSSTVTKTVSADGAGQSATGTCVDYAGHTASKTENGINIDKSDPTIHGAASPSPVNGWNNTDVKVHFDCADALSGVRSCEGDQTLGEGFDQSVTGTATDNVGHVATDTVSHINVDKTPPSLEFVGGPADGANYYYGFVPAEPTCAASDALSGLAGACSVSGYGSALGSHTVTSSVTDKAGNTATVSRTYTVQAWTLKGFYSPVDMNGVVNTVKGGSTVPLKFEVFTGPTELTNVSAVSSLAAIETTCTEAPVDEVEMTATGGTSLRYDSAGGQFIYNWQTPKTAGKCYRVTMTTQDGSSLVAKFKTK